MSSNNSQAEYCLLKEVHLQLGVSAQLFKHSIEFLASIIPIVDPGHSLSDPSHINSRGKETDLFDYFDLRVTLQSCG